MLVLRNATVDDMQQYFDWSNDELVRQNSINTKIVGWNEHQKWFNNKLNNGGSFLYLAENKQSRIGQVRFDCENNKAVLDYSISNNFRGQGLGREMIKQAIERLNKSFSCIKSIKAEVKMNNVASNKILLDLGFVKQGDIKGIIIYHLEQESV